MSANVRVEKQALIGLLRQKLQQAQAVDAERLRVHRAQAAKAFELFRSRLTEALEWDAETAERHNFSAGLKQNSGFYPQAEPEFTTCPMGIAHIFERAIKAVSLDSRKTIPINRNTLLAVNDDLSFCFNWEPTRPRNLCG